MQDRFKFRAYNKELRKMYEVESICPYEDNYTKGGEVFLKGVQYNSFYFPEEVEVMQCTGLKDKNSKLIYEGDVVDKGTRCKWIITWFKNRFILAPDFEYKNKDKCANDRECGFTYFENNHSYADKNVEVIGNIYENPELLED